MFDTNWQFSKQLAGEKQNHYLREAAAERFAKSFTTQDLFNHLFSWLEAKMGQRLQRRELVVVNQSYPRIITNNPMEDCMTC